MTPTPRFTFGTYKKTGQLLDVSLRQALGEAGDRIFLVDTAVKYGNQAEVASILQDYPGTLVGSKVNRIGHVADDLSEIESLFPASLHRVLLHRPMPLSEWKVLEAAKAAGRVAEIGVSNYSAEKLQELLAHCDVKPDVVQNELHPCIHTPVPEMCRQHGVRFEAHSVMSANEHLTEFVAKRQQVTAAQAAIAFCLARGADVCFSTANLQHLRLDLSPELPSLLSPADVEELSTLAFQHPIRRYRSQGSVTCDADALHGQLARDVAAFESGGPFSDLCVRVPKTHRGTCGELARILSHRFFPEAEGCSAHQKFDGLLHKMRKAIEARREEARETRRLAAPKTCVLPREAVAFPEALPVDIPRPACFDAFLQELKGRPTPGRSGHPRRFERGTLFPDGRMDLCKQVIQPCFEELCDSVQSSSAVRHFLLGNNVVFRDGTAEEVASRLAALERLLRSDPQVETWYLAGNAIDAELSAPIAEAFRHASHARALWLKMNPVKTGARHFGRLAALHPGLELLDLFNTGLCDPGLRAFRDGLAAQGGSRSLKHLYLSVNDIADGECVAEVVRLLPSLESLFLGVNLLGDAGAAPVLGALVGHPSLRRLELGSNGLTDASLPLLLDVVSSAPLMAALTLGSYKSTNYFGGRHNDFADAAALARIASHLGFMSLNGGVDGLDFASFEIQVRAEAPDTLVFATQPGKSLWLGDTSVRRGLQHPEPFLKHIESIYRNQM
jgi:diketogulonate reductase-like aldo/keto reductase